MKFTSNNITQFSFLAKNNPTKVIKDVHAIINGKNINIASPYITNPVALIPTFSTNGYKVLVEGIVQESGISSNNFSKTVNYKVVDNNGMYNEYRVNVIYSGLPIVFVDTPNSVPITSKEDWTEDVAIKIVNPDGTVSYEGTTSFRGRGNSTWTYPKKPYAIKLDKKAEILGMPKHKRWILLANWMDRTLMRNRVAFKIGEAAKLSYTPRGEYVELVLNGKHLGNYFLCEQIKVDENRVNIAELEQDSKDITGGYLLELDTYFDEINKFKSSIKNFPYMFKEPDEDILTQDMFNYVKTYINTFEDYLYNHFEERNWADYIDIDSFISYWIAVELTSNSECQHPKSTYMYKDSGSKLCAGPMWDYDWNTFIPSKSTEFHVKSALYYPQLFSDDKFIDDLKNKWDMIKEDLDEIALIIDEEYLKIYNSEKMNISMWPISQRINGDETMSFEEAVNTLKKAYVDKLNWLDQQINML